MPTPSGFILSSNRDENPTRTAASLPAQQGLGAAALLMPTDGLAGGTWVFASTTGHGMVLFNGAFQKHEAQPPYRLSRGIIMKQFSTTPTPIKFWDNVDLQNIEPFSIVYADGTLLMRLSWDGSKKWKISLNPTAPQLWSSCTLYNAQQQEARQQAFAEWVAGKGGHYTTGALLDFLKESLPLHPDYRYLMRRPNVETISITTLQNTGTNFEMTYADLQTGQTLASLLPLTKNDRISHEAAEASHQNLVV